MIWQFSLVIRYNDEFIWYNDIPIQFDFLIRIDIIIYNSAEQHAVPIRNNSAWWHNIRNIRNLWRSKNITVGCF